MSRLRLDEKEKLDFLALSREEGFPCELTDEVMALLDKINREYGTTILMVTHDQAIVNRHRKRTVALEKGHIVADLRDGGYVKHDQ